MTVQQFQATIFALLSSVLIYLSRKPLLRKLCKTTPEVWQM